MTVSQWNKSTISDLLMRSDKAVERAIVLLYNRQTADEQASFATRHRNGRGFAGGDAEIFTSFARRVLSGRPLTPKQLAVARKPGKAGYAKLAKYWRQLAEEIRAKEARSQAAA